MDNAQLLKEGVETLGYPLPSKTEICRYSDDRMDDLYEKFGGLVRVVWGDDFAKKRHVQRLHNALQNVDWFLSLVDQQDYLKGPHRYFYMKMQEDSTGNPLYDLAKNPPTVVPAPRYVVRLVAERIVQLT